MLGRKGRGRRAAVWWHAGQRSQSTLYQQHGGAVEEGFEKSCHFQQLVTHSGYLTGKDVHLERRKKSHLLWLIFLCTYILQWTDFKVKHGNLQWEKNKYVIGFKSVITAISISQVKSALNHFFHSLIINIITVFNLYQNSVTSLTSCFSLEIVCMVSPSSWTPVNIHNTHIHVLSEWGVPCSLGLMYCTHVRASVCV